MSGLMDLAMASRTGFGVTDSPLFTSIASCEQEKEDERNMSNKNKKKKKTLIAPRQRGSEQR